MEKKPVSHFVVGVIISLVVIIFFLAFYYTGIAFDKSAISYLPTLFFIGAIIFAITQYAKAKKHDVTFGSCFSYGFKATAIVAIIMAIFIFCFITFVPEYKDQFLDFMSTEMEKNTNDLSDEQKEQSVNMISKFFLISAVGGGLFMNLLFGAIGSVIGAAVAKKNPQTPFQQG